MALAKRIVLFLVLNFAVVAFISLLLHLFNVQPFLKSYGIDYSSLAVFCLIWGMGGAFISLLLSKVMAKWTMGVQLINPTTQDPLSQQLLQIIKAHTEKAGLPKMPEVGIYESPEVNAFATGPSRANSLVAVSTGLLRRLDSSQVEAVIGHEMTHVANGDMVTMTLLQGVINAFVMFLARALAFTLSRGNSNSREESRSGSSFLYYGLVFIFEMVFMLLGTLIVAWFSRYREFRADAGGARLTTPEKMISALNALKKAYDIKDEQKSQTAFQAFKISDNRSLLRFFATHPPLDDRINRLKERYQIS